MLPAVNVANIRNVFATHKCFTRKKSLSTVCSSKGSTTGRRPPVHNKNSAEFEDSALLCRDVKALQRMLLLDDFLAILNHYASVAVVDALAGEVVDSTVAGVLSLVVDGGDAGDIALDNSDNLRLCTILAGDGELSHTACFA